MRATATHPRTETAPAVVPMLIGGEWREAAATSDVIDPYRGELVARAPNSTLADLGEALDAAVAAKARVAAMPGFERAKLLRRVVDLLLERADDIALTMARETGKAIKDARAEVVRSQDTVSLSAEEAIRIEGAHVPLDGSAMGAGKLAMLLRFPVGVVAGITPFNAPFNLACHKVAPALAAGNAIVLKPPPQAPLTVHKMVELFVDAGTPAGFLNVVYGHEVGPALVRDPRVDFITFTGSSKVGAEIKAASGMRRVALELGGNGPTILCDGRRGRGVRAALRPQRHAPRRPELHLGADDLCPRERLRGFRRAPGRGGRKAQARRSARRGDRRRHPDRRGARPRASRAGCARPRRRARAC